MGTFETVEKLAFLTREPPSMPSKRQDAQPLPIRRLILAQWHDHGNGGLVPGSFLPPSVC